MSNVRAALAVLLLALSGCVAHRQSVRSGPSSAAFATYLPVGTQVPLVVTQAISSSRRVPLQDGAYYLAVASDVAVDGRVFLRAGAPVAAVIERKASAGLGRAGHVSVRPTAALDASNHWAPLRAQAMSVAGRRRAGRALGLGIGLIPVLGPFALLFLGRNGTDVEIGSGVVIMAESI